jgi:hypothetical protein
MTLGQFAIGHILLAGGVGLVALQNIAWFKLSTESIDSPRLVTRWFYRYALFSFWLWPAIALSSVTTWKLLKVPAIGAFGHDHPWLLLVLVVPLALLFYFLWRKHVIACDPVKLKARKGQSIFFRWKR